MDDSLVKVLGIKEDAEGTIWFLGVRGDTHLIILDMGVMTEVDHVLKCHLYLLAAFDRYLPSGK